jgi:hypothetical protein
MSSPAVYQQQTIPKAACLVRVKLTHPFLVVLLETQFSFTPLCNVHNDCA